MRPTPIGVEFEDMTHEGMRFILTDLDHHYGHAFLLDILTEYPHV